jgi:hypothetical protein
MYSRNTKFISYSLSSLEYETCGRPFKSPQFDSLYTRGSQTWRCSTQGYPGYISRMQQIFVKWFDAKERVTNNTNG